MGRVHRLPQRRPMYLTRHHLEMIRQEKTTRETSQEVERRPGQILERYDMAEDSTRQGHLERACGGLRPTTGHYGCSMMMMMRYLRRPVYYTSLRTDGRCIIFSLPLPKLPRPWNLSLIVDLEKDLLMPRSGVSLSSSFKALISV